MTDNAFLADPALTIPKLLRRTVARFPDREAFRQFD